MGQGSLIDAETLTREFKKILRRSRPKITPMQRRILKAMDADDLGFAAFTGERARKAGFGVFDAKHGGIVIRAYQNPEFFLKGRGLIERVERNVPGYWYRITEDGRRAVESL